MNVFYCRVITTSSFKFAQIFTLHKQITVFLFFLRHNFALVQTKVRFLVNETRSIHAAMQFVIVLIGLRVYGIVFSMLLHT